MRAPFLPKPPHANGASAKRLVYRFPFAATTSSEYNAWKSGEKEMGRKYRFSTVTEAWRRKPDPLD